MRTIIGFLPIVLFAACAGGAYHASPPSAAPSNHFDTFGGEGGDADRSDASGDLYAQQLATPGAMHGDDREVSDVTMATGTRPRPGPILIYTASLHLAVFEVTATQEEILVVVRAANGFLANQTGSQLVVRVPAARFYEVLDTISAQGDVLNRSVTTTDVGEEFFDLGLRIRNGEVMRERLEALLARADDVEAALAVERELQRVTEEVERLKGRRRYLADQARYSTITLQFAPHSSSESEPDVFQLPFQWLRNLGLTPLMRLR